MNGHHIHVAGLGILSVIAIVMAANFLARTVAGRHPDSPALQGLAFVL